MHIENEFDLEDIVYLKTDKDQQERIVTCIKISPNGLTYILSYGVNEQTHFACEISKEKKTIVGNIGFDKKS